MSSILRQIFKPVLGTLFLATISLISFNPSFAVSQTTDGSTNFYIEVEDSLELSMPSALDLPITPSSTGTFGSKPLNITVRTNNVTGYTLTMHNDSSDLVHNGDSSFTIPTLDADIAKASFPLNKWGYSLDDSIYKPIITASDTTLRNTNTYTDGDNITVNLATKVDFDKPSGIYTNTFNIAAVAHQSIFTVTWNANGGSVSPTTSSYRYNSPLGTLPEPTQSGYDFKGWFTAATGGTEVTAETPVVADATYWAQWEKQRDTRTLADITYMQDINSDICENTATATTTSGQYQLKDSRDNKLYWVAKLADGHCWMTQNLDLDLSTSKTLTPSDSNVSADWTPERSTITTSSSTVSGWVNDYNIPYSADRGNVYSASGSSSSLTSVDCTVTGNTNCHYHLGNHYNWSAAVASNDTSSKTSGTASDSICPRGWRLPTGGSSGEYKAFTTAYSIASSSAGETALRATPLYFVRSGNVYGGSLLDVGSNGYYWSSTVSGSSIAYSLSFYSSYVGPTYVYLRDYGFSVRCIAQ